MIFNDRKSQFRLPHALQNATKEWEEIAKTGDKSKIKGTTTNLVGRVSLSC